MSRFTTICRNAALLLLATLPVACAQPSQSGSKAGGMSGMDMPGMDMSGMMKRCADMKQSMGKGAMSPDMQKTMSECQAMENDMAKDQPVPNTHDR